MKNRFLLAILLVLSCFSLVSCKKEEPTVELISVVMSSIPSSILNSELDRKISEIKISVLKSDASIEEVNISKDMISEEDYLQLTSVGKQTFTITYEGKTTTCEVVILTNNYTVTVLLPDGTVATGVSVQYCEGDTCYLPEKVNNNGIAEIEYEDAEYYIHLMNLPAGYTYDPNAYILNKNNKNITIQLLALSSLSTGEGTVANPYVVNAETYTLTYEEKSTAGMKYFSFTPTADGTYTISSLAMDKLALNKIKPYIGFMGSVIDMSNLDTTGNGAANFNHTFEAVAGTTYYFVIMVSSADQLPASFDIAITKA